MEPNSNQPEKTADGLALPGGAHLFVDLAGIGAGVICSLLALVYDFWSVIFFQNDGLSVLGVLVATSLLSSAVISIVAKWSAIPSYLTHSLASRLGARNGLVVLFTGGGGLALMATLNALNIGTQAMISVHPLKVIPLVILSVIPVVFFASLGSLLVTALQVPVIPRRSYIEPPPQDSGTGEEPQFSVLPWVVLFWVFCFLSPGLLLFPPPAPVSVEVATPAGDDPSADLSAAESLQPEPPKPFRYSEQSGFFTTPATHWKIVARKTIPGLAEDAHAMASPNSRFFAYQSGEDPDSVIVVDLNRFKVVQTITDLGGLTGMMWSPQSRYLYFNTEKKRHQALVVKPETGKRMPLPLEKNVILPNSQPFWWDQFEVAFFPSRKSPSWLDLKDLRPKSIEDSIQWKQREMKISRGDSEQPTFELPESSRCAFTLAPMITSYLRPSFVQSDWDVEWVTVLALQEKKYPYVHALSNFDIDIGDRLTGTPTGMKIVRIRGTTAEILYFGFEERPEPFFRIAVPEKLDTSASSEFAENLKNRILSVFISAPKINPLLDEVIGPDREAVKAIAQILEWKDGHAVLWVSEEYKEIKEGDIVADVHVWNNGEIESIPNSLPDNWWTTIELIDRETSKPGFPKKSNQIDRRWEVSLSPHRSTLSVDHFRFPVPSLKPPKEEPPRKDQPDSPPDPKPPMKKADSAASVAPIFPPDLPPPEPAKKAASPHDPEEAVLNFILEHHQKLSRKDFDGYLSDYTEYVVYLKRGATDRNYIANHVANLRNAKSVQCTPSGKIKIQRDPNDPERFTLSYPLLIRITEPNGKLLEQKNLVEMGVTLTSKGPKIFSEKSLSSVR